MSAYAELAAVDKRERMHAADMVEALRCAGFDHQNEIPATHGCRGPVTIHETDKLARVGFDGEHVSELGVSDWK